MKKVLIALIILILVTLILVKFFADSPDQKLVNPQATSNSDQPSPIPSPSTKPIEVDESTKLKELNSSLTPEDFSSDYKELKESI